MLEIIFPYKHMSRANTSVNKMEKQTAFPLWTLNNAEIFETVFFIDCHSYREIEQIHLF